MSVQLITPNTKQARRFTPQQKLQILKEWEREGCGIEVAQKYQIHPHTLYRWKKALEQGAETFLWGTRPRPDPSLKRLEKENQKLKEALALQTQELMLLKKRDELDLSGRPPGAHYSKEQRRRIVQEVALLRQEGLTVKEILRSLGVCRSTYYGWFQDHPCPPKKISSWRLTFFRHLERF